MKASNLLDGRPRPPMLDAPPAGSARGAARLRSLWRDLPSPPRALLALGMVFLLLATSGWTANRHSGRAQDAKQAAFSAWLRASVNGQRLPRPNASPSAVSRFFASLTAAQRQRLAERHPLVVGNLDGVPAKLRYRANRISLLKALSAERLRRRTADLTPEGERQSQRRINRLLSLLGGARQILAFDPTGRGRVAEVLGDLDRAERISVVVPGVDVDLLSFERSSKPRSAPAGMARSLYTATRRAATASRVAVVAWADYRTPNGVGMDAATGELAEDGAERLLRLVQGLPRGASTALFCHSYGSVVCGVAAPALPRGRVSDIAVAGSPGMRVNRVSELRTDARVWAARDPSDWIGDVPHLEFAGFGHGEDPVAPAFGARVLASATSRGHTGYFEPGTASLHNFALLALGRYRAVDCAPGRDCTTGLV